MDTAHDRDTVANKVMSSKEPSQLRIAAILVWRHEHLGERGTTLAVEAIKAREEQRIERFRDALQMIFRGVEISFRINGGCIEAEIEDLRFVALEFPASGEQEPLTVVTLLGRCPSCGVEAMSEPFYELSGLGKMLEKFEPIHWHYCYRTGDRTQ
jgi:hypothetical protein